MKDNYRFRKYVYLERWISYWHQIDEVLKLKPKTVLEIGVGNKIVFDCLKRESIDIQTLDIDKELNPNFEGSVDEIPLKDNSFDVVLCAEVLEHLPFNKFEQCLKELKRVSRKNVVLSLPHFGPPIKFHLKFPFVKESRKSFKIPYHPRHKSGGVHYWEIGKRSYSPKRIRAIIAKYFEIKKDFVPFDNQYHHFYILEK
jgi:ubiquinone/menaquinone biosynthesis C-methylase UbiE